MSSLENLVEVGAEFSPCRAWRYSLWRRWPGIWGTGVTYAAFIGLNPSTADEIEDDPTIRRCIRFAKDWGFHGMYMLNIFAYCATDPAKMMSAVDPVGPDNDQAILRYVSDPACQVIVAAWGAMGNHRSRGWEVRRKLLEGFPIKCLGRTTCGQPRHPLYVKADKKLEDYK